MRIVRRITISDRWADLCRQNTFSKDAGSEVFVQPYRLYPEEDGVTVESRQLFEGGSLYMLCFKVEKEGNILKSGSNTVSYFGGRN